MSGRYHLPFGYRKYLIVVGRRVEGGKVQEEEHYLAGPNLQRQEERLLVGCRIRLGKSRIGKDRTLFSVCTVSQEGEWWLLVDPDFLDPENPPEEDVLETKALRDGKTVLALLGNGYVEKLSKTCGLYSDAIYNFRETGSDVMCK